MIASEIVRRAYRLSGIIGAGQGTPAEFAAEGLDTLNEMIDGWIADGLDIGWADLEQTTDITDTSLTYCLRHNLAVILADENGYRISPRVEREAVRTKGALQTWEGENELSYDSALLWGGRGYDIVSDQ